MNHRILFGLAIFAGMTTCAYADGPADAPGRALGSFGAGVSQAAIQPLRDGQPQWITAEPRAKEDCLAESNGVINSTYVRCRRGRQELTRFDASGNRVVLSGDSGVVNALSTKYLIGEAANSYSNGQSRSKVGKLAVVLLLYEKCFKRYA